MGDTTIRSKCLAIAQCHFLYTPYKKVPNTDLYKIGGIANKASRICHYCTIDTLAAILENSCLRFTDVRFLNDSTEFLEVIKLIKWVFRGNRYSNRYSQEFKQFILDSKGLHDLESYTQSYIGFSRKEHAVKEISYHTYTCSFSTNLDSLSMWNYYGATSAGLNLVFDFAWNLFEGSEDTEVNIGKRLENDIVIYRGLILYSDKQKEQCIVELLDKLFELFEEAKENLETYKNIILYAFKESVNNMRCFFKNEAFSCEEEYRVVLKIPEELLLKKEESYDCKILKKGTFRRGNVLIPYIDYQFQKESIVGITINPYEKRENEILQIGLENLLWMHGLQNVSIVHSAIPIRKYD